MYVKLQPSIFPRGYPGIGLVLLRLAVVVGLLSLALAGPSGSLTSTIHTHVLVATVALALLVGLLTRWVAGTCWLLAMASLLIFQRDTGILAPIAIGLCSAALMLLGPGGYSIDAIRYGRRVIRIRE